MANKKDMIKSKLKKTIQPADQLFTTGATEVEKPQKVKVEKVEQPKPVKEIVHRKDTRVKEEYARVNLFMPPEIKANASLLASINGSNLSQLIIDQLTQYVEENADTLAVIKKSKEKLNKGA